MFLRMDIFGQNESKLQTKWLPSTGTSKGQKNIKEGCVCVCTGRAGQKNIVPPTVTIRTALSTSLTTVHISRCKSETWPMRED